MPNAQARGKLAPKWLLGFAQDRGVAHHLGVERDPGGRGLLPSTPRFTVFNRLFEEKRFVMLRARLASLALASSLLVSSGCSSFWCDGSGPFSRCGSSWFGGRAPIMASAPVSGYVGGSECECASGGVVGSTNFHEGAMVVPQGSFVTPQSGVVPPMPTPVSGTQSPPPNGQAPRIITMPNAPATPYNP